MKVTNNNKFGHNPSEYHVGDVIEAKGYTIWSSSRHKKNSIKSHYLVLCVGNKYGVLHLEDNMIACDFNNGKPLLRNSLPELYKAVNDDDDILVDAELLIK